MEVASRENANSQESLHDLQDLIKKIARNEKIEESKELAGDIQDTLTERLQLVSHSEKNRGVKKAPFVVLIGANMPSVLSEISFVSNPSDEKLLRKTDQRQRIADGLYRGIATYLDSLNSLTYNKQKLVSDNHVSDGRLEPAQWHLPGTPSKIWCLIDRGHSCAVSYGLSIRCSVPGRIAGARAEVLPMESPAGREPMRRRAGSKARSPTQPQLRSLAEYGFDVRRVKLAYRRRPDSDLESALTV